MRSVYSFFHFFKGCPKASIREDEKGHRCEVCGAYRAAAGPFFQWLAACREGSLVTRIYFS